MNNVKNIINKPEFPMTVRQTLCYWAEELKICGYDKLSMKVYNIATSNNKSNSANISILDNNHEAWDSGFAKYLMDNFKYVNSNYGFTTYIKL